MCLVRWGNPYVFDRFRFHMTRADRAPADSTAGVGCGLRSLLLDN
ncbi:hypothetical protein BST63_16375 [Bradyrhizobium canariense]|uniref:Uncharacterized protein n=1 Tax=Bradyrhizobium canariense TaxID=255045 RepID=A0ABX3X302_9BRAD|nr:DUF1045 domain-containing protein [Bradyrhizobium canariense]OSJ13523.1 hypothetical protein BSR47_20920 [Bradyrhizobium canariense]OSJ28737.1 hypothetical protein BST63_16375 [Bradyrhizobium canariense]